MAQITAYEISEIKEIDSEHRLLTYNSDHTYLIGPETSNIATITIGDYIIFESVDGINQPARICTADYLKANYIRTELDAYEGKN